MISVDPYDLNLVLSPLADPETRREYAMWVDEALREEGMLDWARKEALEQVVRNMKADGDSPEKIARNTGFTLAQIAEL